MVLIKEMMCHKLYSRDAGSVEGFSVSSELRATLRWAAARGEGDAWLAVAERDTREPIQAAAKVRPALQLTSKPDQCPGFRRLTRPIM